jgi:diguanylate cyclase (GGDEF)-like protein
MSVQAVTVNTVSGRVRPGAEPALITVLSLRLQQGEEPLGSVHFLTDHPSPQIPESLSDFLLSLSAQVAAQLHIQALSFTARVDPLTRLYNSGYLKDRLREEVVRSSRSQQPFSLLLLDIDHLRRVNESHGHQAADEALRGVAALLKRSCRGSDSVCRLSGGVLAVLLADTTLAGAKSFAENTRIAVENEGFVIPGGGRLHVTVSLGVAEFPTHGAGVEELLAQAEQALQVAKQEGRNRWRAAG